MNCSDVQERLSAFQDQELADDVHQEVAAHLELCTSCAADLETAQLLSRQVKSMGQPLAPADLWTGIDRALQGELTPTTVTRRKATRHLPSGRLYALAASILVLVAGGVFWQSGFWGEHEHDAMAATFDMYFAQFSTHPERAHETLIAAYNGQPLEVDQGGQGIGTAPLVPGDGLLGLTLERTYSLDMPCCRCLLSVCRRPDGGVVSVLEHAEPQPEWFGQKPRIECLCDGKPTSVVQVNGLLAASWRQGDRYFTAIGARDLGEVTQLVSSLGVAKGG
jgi:hypothetical protein